MRFDDPYLMAAGGALILAGLSVWLLLRGMRTSQAHPHEMVEGVSLAARPMFSVAELSLYNLIRLAVGDQYLVLAQVPLWSLIEVQASEPGDRAVALRKSTLRRVDVVLVHPGSRTVQTVILLDRAEAASESQLRSDQLVLLVLERAGIPVVHLNPAQTHSIAALQEALSLGGADQEPEDY